MKAPHAHHTDLAHGGRPDAVRTSSPIVAAHRRTSPYQHVAGLGRHHNKIAPLIGLERELLLGMTRDAQLLSARQAALLRWALALGRMVLIQTPEGHDVDVSGPLEPFREWLTDNLQRAIQPEAHAIDGAALRSMCPAVAARVQAARDLLLTHFVQDFGAAHLDAELMHKELVLVLGGGGGSGFVHLATFGLVEELGLTPRLIVGSSMGSLLGLFRAMRIDYDHEATLLAVPRSFDLTSVLSTFTGNTRFGFPGLFHMQLLRAASNILTHLFGSPRVPRFSELPIRFEAVSTGVRTGFAGSEIQRQVLQSAQPSMSPFALRRRMQLFIDIARQLAANPQLLRQIVFGYEEGTWDFATVEAVGFSCSVPGLLHYDVFHDDPHTVSTLEAIAERHQLWRLTDGGVVNNVPSRVAWESVMRGSIGSRNAFILAGDAFAPTGSNFLFTPIQQITRPAVLANRRFSDFHKTFKSTPNPINLTPGYAKLQRVVAKAIDEYAPDRDYLKLAMSSLPPFGEWSR